MTRVKICGITSTVDALATADAGADLLGFVFYPPSPRSVTPRAARHIVSQLRQAGSDITTVGVFVDRDVDSVREIAERCGLDAVQLHGEEPPQAVEILMGQGLMVFKAFRVCDADSLAALGRYRPSAYLLDAYVPDQHGGTGQRFDWSLVAAAQAHGSILLAGGLTPENVARAVRQVQPWGVDTASGVEAAPGRKDHQKVRAFVAAARAAQKAAAPAATGEGKRYDG